MFAHSHHARTKQKGFIRSKTPPWLITFADLMALLLTFFIMMLSFSTMDNEKYKAVAKSMEDAFGPGSGKQLQGMVEREELNTAVDEQVENFDAPVLKQRVQNTLNEEIKLGIVEVEVQSGTVVIRFPEKVAFPSGSADLHDKFTPVLVKIVDILEKSNGNIVISGHTDNIPIHNEYFRSNWELSTGRAVSVVQALLDVSTVDPERFVVQGFADTKPLKPNTNVESRAANRRVEISIENNPE